MISIRYRADIDGLRAIAVLAVLFFHAGLAPVTGGFVGVDVFFVISGYLITSIIVSEVSRGEFTYAGFYERRIRRIIPALMTVIATSVVIGWYVLVPGDYVDFARSAIAAAAFYSNFFFNDQAEDYFAPDSDMQPLLHTWSLGVEEQFYLIAPFLILLLLGRFQRFRGWLVAGIFAVSLAISVYSVQVGWPSAFYLLPSRAFELMIGMALALGLAPEIASRTLRQIAGFCGLAMIVFAAIAFTAATPFPGAAALIPCLGAALLIQSGGQGDTLAHRVLATLPMVFIGRISYSLYLWHWPLLAYARYTAVDPLTMQERVGLLGLAFVLSVVTYYCIEQPVRQRRVFATRRQVFAGGGVALAGCLVVTLGIVATRGAPMRLPAEAAEFAQALPGKTATHARCMQGSTHDVCLVGATDPPEPSFLLWGDSHAQMLSRGLAGKAAFTGLKGRTVMRGGCPPVLWSGQGFEADLPKCERNMQRVKQILRETDIRDVILVGRWGNYYSRFGQEFVDSLRRTVEAVRVSHRTVTLIGPVPELPFNLPKAMTRDLMRGTLSDYSVPAAAFHTRQLEILKVLAELDAMPGVRVLYPHLELCNNLRCRTVADGRPLYVDDDHLSAKGVEVIAKLLDDALAVQSIRQEVVGRVEQPLH